MDTEKRLWGNCRNPYCRRGLRAYSIFCSFFKGDVRRNTAEHRALRCLLCMQRSAELNIESACEISAQVYDVLEVE